MRGLLLLAISMPLISTVFSGTAWAQATQYEDALPPSPLVTQGDTTEYLGAGGSACIPNLMHVYCYGRAPDAPDARDETSGLRAQPQPAPLGPEYDPSSPLYDPALPPPAETCVPVAPTPPTPAWDAAPFPASGTVFADPHLRGLTGLESRFWWTGPMSVSWSEQGSSGIAADCSPIPPPSRSYVARIVEFEWSLGSDVDPTTGTRREVIRTSQRPGTASDPAVRHVYESKDPQRVVTVEAVWRSSNPRLGEFRTQVGSTPHPTVEARAVLTD